MKATITLLPGDGIGPEVLAEAVKVLKAVEAKYEHTFTFQDGLIGGAAIDATGSALPEDTLQKCLQSDAVFLAAVGDPKYDDPRAPVRPEQGLLGLRKALGVFANLRPIKLYKQLLHASTIKPEVLEDVDDLMTRYTGSPGTGSEQQLQWSGNDLTGYAKVIKKGHVALVVSSSDDCLADSEPVAAAPTVAASAPPVTDPNVVTAGAATTVAGAAR